MRTEDNNNIVRTGNIYGQRSAYDTICIINIINAYCVILIINKRRKVCADKWRENNKDGQRKRTRDKKGERERD